MLSTRRGDEVGPSRTAAWAEPARTPHYKDVSFDLVLAPGVRLSAI